MLTRNDILQIILVIAATISLALVMRFRRRQHARFIEQYAQAEVCEHLRPVLDQLVSRGHRVVRAGQNSPDAPLELHLLPAFDPRQVAEEMDLQPPVYLSERNVLYCREDFCELHPRAEA